MAYDVQSITYTFVYSLRGDVEVCHAPAAISIPAPLALPNPSWGSLPLCPDAPCNNTIVRNILYLELYSNSQYR